MKRTSLAELRGGGLSLSGIVEGPFVGRVCHV